MVTIAAEYRKKNKLDERMAWIGRAFSALRSRMLTYGGGEIVTAVEMLRKELSGNGNETVDEMLDWMAHFESQQRGMYSRIIQLTDLLSKKPDLQAIPEAEQVSMFRRVVGGLPEAERIRVAEFKHRSVLGDPEILQAVLEELLLNSIKFSPPDSEVNVFLSSKGGELIVQIVNCCATGSSVLEAVEKIDTSGLGEPFIGGYDLPRFQLSGHDLCIGLSFSLSLMHKIGGSLSVSTVQDYLHGEPRQRFAVTIAVPLADELPQQPPARRDLRKIASRKDMMRWTEAAS